MKGRIISNFVRHVIPQYNFGKYEIQPIVKNAKTETWMLIYTDDINVKSKHIMTINWGINDSGALQIEKLVWHPNDEYEKKFYNWQYRSARRRHRSLRKYSDVKLLAECFNILQSLK